MHFLEQLVLALVGGLAHAPVVHGPNGAAAQFSAVTPDTGGPHLQAL